MAGHGRFTGDLPAARWVRFVRSSVASGRIKRIMAPEGATVVTAAALHVRLDGAALEATATGLVTTRTAWPFVGSSAGVIVSGATAIVPALVKVTVAGAECCPLDSAQ